MLSSMLARDAQGVAGHALRCSSRIYPRLARRAMSTPSTSATGASPSGSTPASSPLPWFVDPSEEAPAPSLYALRAAAPQASAKPVAPLPASLPHDHPIVRLHSELKASPHLEPGTLLVCRPIPTSAGPPLPASMPKGRRRRGRTYVGEGVPQDTSGIWEWLVVAQVKEGTENRGSIESVIRVVRKALLTAEPPLPLPLNNKRRVSGGWAMIDAGDFAIHILSKEAREKFFPERRDW
ncbi:hypothetical protein C8Q79DRAFT_1067100 [Trametes meyenii]|nr:hypothetical protein C8Q79DRAFT_1067100 [Trametes meyenii]